MSNGKYHAHIGACTRNHALLPKLSDQRDLESHLVYALHSMGNLRTFVAGGNISPTSEKHHGLRRNNGEQNGNTTAMVVSVMD